MKWFRITSLQQRLTVLLVLPVSAVLILVGMSGYFYARGVMLDQWREAALLKLERAAHAIDMRLAGPLERIQLLSVAGDAVSRQQVLDQLATMPGVTKAQLEWLAPTNAHRENVHGPQEPRHMMRFHRVRVAGLSSPVLDADAGTQTITIDVSLLDRAESPVGRLVVEIDFNYLVQSIINFGWAQSHMGCVVDKQGTYLLHTDDSMKGRQALGDTGDPLEARLREAIRMSATGTVIGSGSPPSMVAGYHALSRAPWTIAIFAPGEAVLSPILRFQIIYFLGVLVLLMLVVLLIRRSVGPVVAMISRLSDAATEVAWGSYGERIERQSDDEIGRLIDSYNSMVDGLKERDHIRSTFGLYIDEDVARDLLARSGAVQLGGEKREVVVLMSDIRGFTPLADNLSPEETLRVLNHYFHYMIREIKAHHGIIVDFVGDAILVLFDPVQDDLQAAARRALACGQHMQAAMTPFNDAMRAEGLPPLTMGIGIHAGSVVVGNIGSESRAKYGIVGAAVNVTQRIQEKASGGDIVVTDSFCRHVSGTLNIVKSMTADLRGVHDATTLHYVK